MFRLANENDIPELIRLLYQVHKLHADARPDIFMPGSKKYSENDLRDILSKSDTEPIFVLEKDGGIVGYAFCQIIRESDNSRTVNTLYIDDLCVDENARGQKIGTFILEKVFEFAREQGLYNITLNVWALNDKAIKFYEKNGMQVQKIGMEKIL